MNPHAFMYKWGHNLTVCFMSRYGYMVSRTVGMVSHESLDSITYNLKKKGYIVHSMEMCVPGNNELHV